MTDHEALSPQRPWVHQVSAAVVDDLVREATSGGALVIQFDGSKMRSVEELFREYVREFRFPEYFGWNWAAFAECMRGLDARPAHAYLTVIRNSGQLLQDEPDDAPTFMRQLENIGQRWSNSFGLDPEWGGGEVPFNTIMVQGRRFPRSSGRLTLLALEVGGLAGWVS